MGGIGGYVGVVIIWTAVVVVAAFVIEDMMSSVDRRRRRHERIRDDGTARDRSALRRIAPPQVWILIACALVGIAALFTMAERTVTAVDIKYPWLG
ncbi:MAG TPA: hypothetical protein VKZ79_06895 [Alphaproteobacteria bacterium]|nr:hypothetical protein [Alphaproteobacteria bacterium]